MAARLVARGDAERLRYDFYIAGGDVAIEDLTAIVMLPDSVRFKPGSARLDGRPIADPEGLDAGTVTVRLGVILAPQRTAKGT